MYNTSVRLYFGNILRGNSVVLETNSLKPKSCPILIKDLTIAPLCVQFHRSAATKYLELNELSLKYGNITIQAY